MLYFEVETWWLISYGIQLLTVLRVLLRENRSPTARLAWIVCIMAIPWLGIVLYFFFGEVSFGRKDVARMQSILAALPKTPPGQPPLPPPDIPILHRQAFARAASVNGFRPCGGNTAELTGDSNDAIERLVADIHAAKDHVHLLFYIWLTDTNGLRVVDACAKAAARGVTVRVMVDGMGSRALLASDHWEVMRAAGVKCGVAFSLRQAWIHLLFKRMDIRNHRKIAVIDNRITYCGSQNCADPEFRVKPKFAPWVDIMVRLTGPVVWQNQVIFAGDWESHTGESITHLLDDPMPYTEGGFPAIAIGTGPTESFQAVPDIFQNLVASAQEVVTVTTPYYVPSEALNGRLCSAAMRGVKVRLIVPKNNDSALVRMASHSYYLSLLRCGVEIYEYRPGLLHSKLLTVDGEAVLFGSANLDRRSFDINFENCILASDRGLAGEIDARQAEYLRDSDQVTLAEVEAWPLYRKLLNNTFATMGPLL
ncbi:Cardiolipin synthase [Pseudoruegeria aquimaris]|uniref:Cardiolipin synthase n=1 Tax=Pseudoruegeria aquimaris TaxID=393663 RepID=A0A1Y5S5U0_9RHOB|nr:Cardiolipin synthase [Pseudoruegeria aquimaris]